MVEPTKDELVDGSRQWLIGYRVFQCPITARALLLDRSLQSLVAPIWALCWLQEGADVVPSVSSRRNALRKAQMVQEL